MISRIRHGSVTLALHLLRRGRGRSLLWLHGLGERAPAAAPEATRAWPGPVYALDFTGHGQSSLPVAGGYTAELLMADADAALARLGSAALVGCGVGAYAALLLAGGRPAEVRGAVLADGPGLSGGGPSPRPPSPPAVAPRGGPPDPYALAELSIDVRPPDYATVFADLAAERSGLEAPLAVAAAERPAWLAALIGRPGVVERALEPALAALAVGP